MRVAIGVVLLAVISSGAARGQWSLADADPAGTASIGDGAGVGGREVWRWTGAAAQFRPASADDERAYAFDRTNRELRAFHLANGAVAWSYAIDDATRPMVANGLVVVASRRDIHVLNATTGENVWRASAGGSPWGIHDGRLLVVRAEEIRWLDLRTGGSQSSMLVRHLSEGDPITFAHSIGAIVTCRGQLAHEVVAIASDRNVAWTRDVENCQPTVVGATVAFVAGDTGIELRTGREMSTLEQPVVAGGSPFDDAGDVAYADGRFFKGTGRGAGIISAGPLFAIDESTGEIVWQSSVGQDVAALAGTTLYAALGEAGAASTGDAGSAYLHALDARTGTWRWSHWFRGENVTGVAVSGAILIVSTDRGLYALDTRLARAQPEADFRFRVERGHVVVEATGGADVRHATWTWGEGRPTSGLASRHDYGRTSGEVRIRMYATASDGAVALVEKQIALGGSAAAIPGFDGAWMWVVAVGTIGHLRRRHRP